MIPLLALVGLGYLIYKGLAVSDTAESFQVSLASRLQGFDTKRLVATVVITPTIDNPTANSITVSDPYVEIYEGAKLLAHSIPTGGQTRIEKKARTTLPDIKLEIPATVLLSTLIDIPKLLKSYLDTGALGRHLTVNTRVTGAGITVTEKQDFDI